MVFVFALQAQLDCFVIFVSCAPSLSYLMLENSSVFNRNTY